MKGHPFNFDACILKASHALQDGRTEEGIEELRRGIFESAKLSPSSGRRNVEKILTFAHENEIFDEVETTFDDEPLKTWFFGNQ